MKFSSIVFLTLASGASAFAPSRKPNARFLNAATLESTEEKESSSKSAVLQSVVEEGMEDQTLNMNTGGIQPGRYAPGAQSIAIPFMKRPAALDGSHAGDFGFDPLGFTEDNDLYAMQEAELRHGRLAMLAVIGWPLSELLAPDSMLQNGMAPSVLNGFNPLSLASTAVIFAGLGFFEFKTSLRRTSDNPNGIKHREDMANVWKYGVAGDYNFDPLGLYNSIGDDAVARKGLREVEVSHGRSAMLGITAFVIWEKLTGHAIVENSMFFHPNLLLPFLTAAYIAFTTIYEVSIPAENSKLLQFDYTSEGEMKVENLKKSVGKTITKISNIGKKN